MSTSPSSCARCHHRTHFRTLAGDDVGAVSRAQMTEIDRIATEETGPSLAQMMAHAGRSMTILTIKELTVPWHRARVLVIAGPGNNGGGGIAAARHLVGRVGRVELCLTRPDALSAAAAGQLRTYRESGGDETDLPPPHHAGGYDVVVDTVLGYGLEGAPRGEEARAIGWMEEAGRRVLSLDLPSGLDADAGRILGVCAPTTATLTLHLPKPGLGNPIAGRLYLADLGIPAGATLRAGVVPVTYGPTFVTPLERVMEDSPGAHPGTAANSAERSSEFEDGGR